MKKRILLLVFIAMISLNSNAQTVFGLWKNVNEETGKIDSVIEVYKKDGKAYAKVVELTDSETRDAVCSKCKDYRKNKPMLGMQILSGLSEDGDQWNDGEILDPLSGNIYACYIALETNNKLKVKGHLRGFSFIGRSVYWERK